MSAEQDQNRRRARSANDSTRSSGGRRSQADYDGRGKAPQRNGQSHARRSAQASNQSGRPANQQVRRRSSAQGQQSQGQARQGQRPAQQQRRRAAQGNAHQAKRAQQQHAGARNRSHAAVQKKAAFSPVLIGAIVAAVIVLGVGGFFLVRHLTTKHLTVNSEAVTVARTATPRDLVEQGLVTTTPGNLLAVDGSLLSKGDGDPCFATADGHPIGVDDEIPADSTVEVGDGHDTTEEYDEKEEAIQPSKSDSDTSFSGYWTGAIHLLSDGEEGVQTTKTGKQSKITVTEVTKPAVDSGYVIYSAKPEDKVIALTFDDGPWDTTTSAILDILEQYNAKATFFTIGSQIAGHEDLIKREKELGCEVLTHTWDHSEDNLGNLTASQQVKEVQDGYASIAKVLGEEPPHVMRAPGGNFNGDTIDNLWDYVDAEIGWDVDTEDWRRPGSDSIANMILSASSGNVILMHDGGGDRTQTVEALRQALPKLIEQGYTFVTIDELLAYGMPVKSTAISSSSATSTTSSDSSSTSTTDSGTESTSSSTTSDNGSSTATSDSSASSSSDLSSSSSSSDSDSSSTMANSSYGSSTDSTTSSSSASSTN